MSEKKNTNKKNSREKLELAQKIASNSKMVAKTYANVENTIVYFFRRVLSALNKIIFDSRFAKLAALVVAVVIYIAVNADSTDTLNITQASRINDIPVDVVYNDVIYEISGIPKSADVIVTGDMSDITLQKSQVNSRLTADLSGLTEGVYSIKLTPTNFISRLEVNVVDTPTVFVTIKKKSSSRFNITSDFINLNKMDSMYTLGDPTFDTTEVLVRASQDTIDSIAFVKALIDVTGVTQNFTKSARLVAYDQSGKLVDCDIIPETVTATVSVSSPSKEVPIVIRTIGNLPEGLAIDDISLDYSTVTIYASNALLDTINAFYIDLDVSGINKNTVVSTALSVPSGANKINITKVNMEISVGEVTTRTFENVEVQWINYNEEYYFSVTNADDAYQTVVVTGTERNVNALSVDDIICNMDLKDIVLGVQEVPLIVTGSNNYVTYEVIDGKTTVEIQVIER